MDKGWSGNSSADFPDQHPGGELPDAKIDRSGGLEKVESFYLNRREGNV